jgi:hypothetical protein
MLKRTFAPLIVLPLFTLVAQDAAKVREPEYIGVVVYIDSANGGALTPLERQQPNRATKIKGLGFGGGEASVTFDGPKSSTRFKVGQEVEFVVRVNAPGIEPDSLVNLDALTVAKDKRVIVTAKAALFKGSKTLNGQTLRPLNFSKYGDNSLKFSAAQPLEPGEYVITTKGGSSAFLFGVDPK